MATVISIYDDQTGQQVASFMVADKKKKKRRLFWPEAIPLGLIMFILAANHGLFG